MTHSLDEGTEDFDPSHLEITSIDVGNTVSNIIPQYLDVRLNIRFNPLHTIQSLLTFIQDQLDKMGIPYQVSVLSEADAFLTSSPALQSWVGQCIKSITGSFPQTSTSGGTSDARFLKDLGPTIELGLTNNLAHKVDECVPVDHLIRLEQIYRSLITGDQFQRV